MKERKKEKKEKLRETENGRKGSIEGRKEQDQTDK